LRFYQFGTTKETAATVVGFIFGNTSTPEVGSSQLLDIKESPYILTYTVWPVVNPISKSFSFVNPVLALRLEKLNTSVLAVKFELETFAEVLKKYLTKALLEGVGTGDKL
jgi:hypothetical protein